MRRAALAALLALLTPAARAAAPQLFDQVAATATWDDNLSNSDRAADRIEGLRVEVRAQGLHLRETAGGSTLRLTHHVQLEAARNHPSLSQATAGATFRNDHKFGLGPHAPILGFALGAEGLLSREEQRNGIAASADIHARLRLGDGMLLELREELSRREARADVFAATVTESIVKLTYDTTSRWEFTAESRLRHGDAVSYAVPPRPDLLGEARAIASLDTFGTARTAYAIRARSVTTRLTAARMIAGGWLVSAGLEPRTTRRGAISYSNRRWTFGVGKLL